MERILQFFREQCFEHITILPHLGKYTNYFTYLGVGVASVITCKFALSLWSATKSYCLARLFAIGPDLKKMGKWAVVTGPTDGIGKAYAQELARKGLNIVLISRSPEKLERVSKEIEIEHRVQTKCIAVDFTTLGMGIYEKIKRELEGMEVGILVNNVGICNEGPEPVTETPEPKPLMDMVNVNCQPLVQMTWIILPQMVSRNKGAIINVSSMCGATPTPGLAVYSGTKAFVDNFTETLQYETRGTGVIVQLLTPFFVSTAMNKLPSNILVPTVTTYARAAVATIGLTDRAFGCAAHGFESHMCKLPKLWVQYGLDVALHKVGINYEAVKQKEAKYN